MDPDNPHLAASQLESQYLPHPSRPKTHPPTGSGPGQFRRSLSQDVTRNQGKHRRKQSSEDLCDIPKQPPKDRGAGRGPRGEVARVQTSGLCASRARERGLAGGQPQAPGAPGAGPHPAWSTRGHSEPSTGHTRFLCSSTAPANPPNSYSTYSKNRPTVICYRIHLSCSGALRHNETCFQIHCYNTCVITSPNYRLIFCICWQNIYIKTILNRLKTTPNSMALPLST